MSPAASYLHLFRLAGFPYVLIAFLGRLPAAMSQMGTLLLVADATGTYAAGGVAAGALAVANAAGSPLAGALADRIGQRPVVLAQSLAGGAGLAGLVLLAGNGAGTGTLVVVAALTGAVIPQVGPLARVRWRPLAAGVTSGHGRLMAAAFSYEGAADEASFVLGPALIGLAVAAADPGVALGLAAVMLVVFGSAFALHPTARVAHAHTQASSRDGGRLLTGLFVGLLAAQLLIGVLFGSVQAGNGVLATAEGEPGLAGLVHALLGVGSVVAGLAMAAVPEHITQATRTVVAAVALLVLAAPLLWVGSIGESAIVMVVLGFAVAPYMISNFTRGEHGAPPSRVAAAMTLLAGATGIGYALGASVAGRLGDTQGHTAAFAVTVGACALAAVLSLVLHPAVRRERAPASVG